MAYIELDSVLFRASLNGATGTAKLQLTADAVNAVDTINIGNNQVTYSKYITVNGLYVKAGYQIMSISVEIFEESTWIEITAYANRGGAIKINGTNQVARNRRTSNIRVFPAIQLVNLPIGTHNISLHSNSAGTCEGYIMARYIRSTGA